MAQRAEPEVRIADGDQVVVVVDSAAARRDWRARITRPAVGAALAVVGAVAILVGYLGVAHESLVAKQMPYLVSGGIGGMVLVAVGAFLLGTEDVRRQLEKVDHLESMVEDLHGALLRAQGSAAPAPAPAAAPARAAEQAPTRPIIVSHGANGTAPHGGLVALARARSFHRPDCTMVAGKTPSEVDDAEIEARGLTPCPLCDPLTSTVS